MRDMAFDSDDIGLIEATVSSLYSQLHIRPVGAATRTRITRRTMTPEVGFDDLDLGFDAGYAGEAPGLLIICDVVSGTIRRVGEGRDETFGPGDMFVIAQPDLPYSGIAHAPRLRLLVMDPVVLPRAWSGGVETGPAQLTDHRPLSSRAVINMRNAISYVHRNVMEAGAAAQTPLVTSSAAQYLGAHLLQAFPNTALATPPVSGDGRDASSATLRRAVSFIEANPDTELSARDIAHAAHVTVRALQLAFRRHLDTTPMAYLRRVRLERAHDELAAASPEDGKTVTDIAYKWGFSSPSRFAERHRGAYGITPSEALRG